MEVTGAWTAEETRAFLSSDAGTVPARLACHTTADELWMLSLWYTFCDGCLLCATAASADVVRFLRHDPRVAFEVSVDRPPYRGVRGRGEATVLPDEDKQLLRELLERYLGGTDSALADRLLAADREEVRIRIEPTTLSTWDYTDRMADAADDVSLE
ncbi:pyridoxamine 5'-phosphate oxidase family protein [Halorarius litoreus]|uniref:pyridoxamine 5'-phosphate oxidase family protein n=1 Tax=Halorarius litoreus TaxID=2962676 RepID=UPI0020CCBE94|nr:pyridoxamine 5'-phosphate oxidase family protein [Halorarius litoreus]